MRTGSIGRSLLAMAMLGAATIAPAQGTDAGAFRILAFGAKQSAELHKAGAVALTTEGANQPELPTDVLFIEARAEDVAATRKLLLADGTGPTLFYETIGTRVPAKPAARDAAATLAKGTGEAPIYYLFANLNPGAGKEAEFNAFYDSTHLPEVLRVPGMLWGERGRLVSTTPASFAAPRYMALYQFRSFDLNATMAEVTRRLRDGSTQPFPAGTTGPGLLMFYGKIAHSGAHK